MIEYEKAIDLFAAGKKEEAAAALLSLIESHPDCADAYESLGMIYYKMGRLDEAIDWTTRLAAMRPEYPMAHTNLSIFYMKKGMKERAEEEKAKAVVLSFGGK
ncbi:MAG: tetratricopeptide repeat protein [Candidatus Omnitrophica bacterium]|nr:tetratricopeptide repeat protein [Candidatus Omnitrophota bacterium]